MDKSIANQYGAIDYSKILQIKVRYNIYDVASQLLKRKSVTVTYFN